MKIQMNNRIFVSEKKAGGTAVKVYDFTNMANCINSFLERGAKTLGEIAMGYFKGEYDASPQTEAVLPPEKAVVHYKNYC